MATKHQKSRVTAAALNTWDSCNDMLRDATEEEALEMLNMERSGKARQQYLIRIHARYNLKRGARERSELAK